MPASPTFLLPETTPALPPLLVEHEPALVGLSLLVAMLCAAIALALAERARDASSRQLRQAALAAAALALGAGVWAMHFIGMLALRFCGSLQFDPLWTVGSVVPSLAAAWVALRGLAGPSRGPGSLLLGGLMMGGGIGLMHYAGMAAVQTSAQLRYDPAWFLASLVVAVALAVLALWLQQSLRDATRWRGLGRWRTALAAAVLGGAISGMHYTAMGAVRLFGPPVTDLASQVAGHLGLALGVALTTLLVGSLAVGVYAVLVQRQLLRERLLSEARLQALVDTAVDGIVQLDEARRVVAANQAAQLVFGASADSLQGQAIGTLLPVLAGEGPWPAGIVQTQVQPGDGPLRRLRLAIGHRAQGSVIFLSDITESERRRTELEGVQAAIQRGLVVVEFDLEGRILEANPAFLALTGHSRDSLVGRHHRVLCRPEEAAAPAYAAHWAALRQGESLTGDFQRVRHDGQPIWIRATYNPILDTDGRPQRIVKFVSDLTERHLLEQDLRLAKATAERAAAAKSSFLANMSHEIRTPMNAIIGFSEVALEAELAPDTRQHLATIHRSARSLLGLLNDILDTAKLDHGAVELEPRDFSPRQVCEDVLATVRLSAERKRLALRLQADPALPEVLHGDPLRLQQILLNLVGNAVKFTEQGAVSLELRPLPDGRTEFAVQDSGIGIARDRIERIFDPFTQADATMTRRFGGTGLGTTIARQLSQLMGGEIGVESVLGLGSRFWVRLPLAPGEAGAVPVAMAPQLPVPLPPLRLLAADDVPENLQLLTLRLRAQGHTVHTAQDGQQALEALRLGRYDLALLDVQMPHLSGLQACERWRAEEARRGLPRLPVIALTASAGDGDRALTAAAGMDGFAVKPIDWPALTAEIARVLGLEGLAPPAPRPGPSPAPTLPGLPEPVDWPQAMARWGDTATWLAQLRSFLLAHQADPLPRGAAEAVAQAHRLRGAAANFGLPALAAEAAVLEQAQAPEAAAWQRLQQRLQALCSALPGEPAVPAQGPLQPWPSGTAKLLQAALARGEWPEAACRQVLDALPGPARARLQAALDGFDFEGASALLAQLELEFA